MELIKRNIHMDRVKRSTVMQFTMEEDLNLPEDKPDISTLNLEKGEVVIEEICPGTDEVTVRGKLGYAILYHTRESGSSLVLLGGALPFEERIRMEGVLPSDTVTVEGTVEDFTVNMINSRKLSLQALILLSARIEEIYDEELPVGIQGEDTEAGVEYRIEPMEVTQLAICKNDIFRKKEEIPLPSSYPNIYQILWSNISLRDVEFKPQEEKLAIQGDIQIFVLYEAEGEDRAIRSYETTLPLNGSLECQGCREDLLPDIRYTLLRQEPGQQTLTIQPDLDGEERILGMECALELNIRLYEEEQIDILRDIYGVKNEVIPDTRQTSVRQLLTRITGKTKITDHAGTNIDGPILQILHSEGTASIDHRDITEDGIRLQGSIDLTVLCITEKDETPYVSTRIQIPYEYLLSVPGIGDTDQAEVHCEMEQLQVNLIDGEEVDVKATVDAPSGFTDVADGQWYSDAIAWAAANGIVNGVGGNKFAPSEPVTREQLAAIFFRYAKFCGVKTEAGMLDAFRDAASVSDYAREAMGWAVKAGLAKGDGQDLMPKATASRAQAAAILHRFAAVVEK